ncbi:FliH/SctL family protein [Paenibacillus senegalensis]|uniref:FliH/SctL family protein n=1 Tax=Paenibacillus senegalensis TaxID=1465766 RepID=UPI0002893931|nr:FliH/SctL family protein [Paenibacillus senegalensis]
MSRLIKPEHYISVEQKKVVESLLEVARSNAARSGSTKDSLSFEEAQQIQEASELKDQILKDAEQLAETRIRQASEEAEKLKAEAKREIDEWWSTRREQDADAAAQARQLGYDEGYQAGLVEAETKVNEQCARQIAESRVLLEQAYETKQHIINEAEPFLLELSCSIAEKIVQRQLTVTPEWIGSITKEMLARKRERGVITLCVAPQQYSYMQSMHEELAQVIDSQAELRIVPDLTVKDQGCVIRSELGSIDARIQTQLNEIKQAMLQLAAAADQSVSDERYA